MQSPSLTVIIPVHNGASTLERCLTAALSSEGGPFDFIVVDDGSTDGTAEILGRHPVEVVRHDCPRGAAVARNTGAARARGDLLCFLDADIVVGPDTLLQVVRSLEEHDVDGVVGMLGSETEHGNFASQYENLYMHYMYLHHSEEMDIFYTSLAGIRREVFAASGGFDEAYAGAGIEDMELGQRLVREGRRLRLNKKLSVYHLKRFHWRQLLEVNRKKAAGTLKIMLRNRGKKTGSRKHVGPDWGFLLGIPATYLGGLGLAAAVLLRSWPVAALALLVLAVVAGVNRRFLSFLFIARGFGFLLAATVFFYLQFVNYGIGLTAGLAGYLFGDKY